jgi:hypothetical protein
VTAGLSEYVLALIILLSATAGAVIGFAFALHVLTRKR